MNQSNANANINTDDLNDLNATGQAPVVLIVGPPEHTIGGMATVVGQQRSLSLDHRYNTAFFAITMSSIERESLLIRLARHARHLMKLHKTIRRINPTIVHIHTCSGFSFYRSVVDLLIAKLSHCPVVLHIHGAAFDDYYESLNKFGKRLIRWSLAQADRVIALSKHWQQSLTAMSPKARIVVIENAVAIGTIAQEPEESRSTSLQTKTSPRPSRQSSLSNRNQAYDRPCRFLMLARMDTWKGVDDFLDAMVNLRSRAACKSQSIASASLPSLSSPCDNHLADETKPTALAFECILAGPEGSAGNEVILNKKIEDRSLGDHVRYIGAIQGESKKHWLHWADVLVQPSHHEGMPIAMLEALAVGLPIVATKVGAVPEVITDHVEGLLVPPHSPCELAAALQTIANDLSLREKFGQAAKRLAVTRFGLDRFDADLVQLYDDLVHLDEVTIISEREVVLESSSTPRSTIMAVKSVHDVHAAERSSHSVPS